MLYAPNTRLRLTSLALFVCTSGAQGLSIVGSSRVFTPVSQSVRRIRHALEYQDSSSIVEQVHIDSSRDDTTVSYTGQLQNQLDRAPRPQSAPAKRSEKSTALRAALAKVQVQCIIMDGEYRVTRHIRNAPGQLGEFKKHKSS